MNTWENTVLTEQGRALMAKLTQGHTLDITMAVAGAGFVTPGLLMKQTQVTDPKQSLVFRPATYPEKGLCKLPVVLTNNGLNDGYKATQVGIYATDPDEGEILLFISQAADAASGTIIPSATEMPGYSAEWNFHLRYGQADGVNITVDPTASVSRAEMEEYVNAYVEEYALSKNNMEAFINEVFKPITSEEIEELFEGTEPGSGDPDSTVSHIDFSNFNNGTWTETLRDGTLITHTNTFDSSGRVTAIDNITITW